VTFDGPLRVGQFSAAIVVASTNGLLQGWIDFNSNSNWSDAGEQIFTNRLLAPGTNRLSFQVPVNAAPRNTFARFRFSSARDLTFAGPAPDGEVEDYLVAIQAAVDLKLTMTGVPDPVPIASNLTYTITISNRGPSTASGVTLTDFLPSRVAL